VRVGLKIFGFVAAAVSSDGRLIAYASQASERGYLALQEVATGKVVRLLEHLPNATSIIAFSPDAHMLAIAGCREQAIRAADRGLPFRGALLTSI
jgi:Tol biopolymer transport system component